MPVMRDVVLDLVAAILATVVSNPEVMFFVTIGMMIAVVGLINSIMCIGKR